MKPSQALAVWLQNSGFDGILVAQSETVNSPNLGYLTGFWGSFGVYLQTQHGRWLLTDSRYAEAAQALAKRKKFTFVLYQGGMPEEFLTAARGVLAVEDRLTVAQLKHYRRWFKGVKLKPQSGVVEALRQKKSATEKRYLRLAHAQVDQVLLPFLQANLRTGITERSLKFKLDQVLQHEGRYGLSFDSIVAFGPSSAQPHHRSDDRPLAVGHNILIDCGVTYQGYASDMTRNFGWGTVSPNYLQHYKTLQQAQQATLAQVKAGVKAKEVDAFCRQQLGDLAPYFTHSLGHGVGLEIHEAPNLTKSNKQPLKTDEVVTVEPGLYFAGQYGIRIEDTVIVGKAGPEVLTKTSKNWLSFDEEGRVQSGGARA